MPSLPGRRPLTLACGGYDINRALLDGSVVPRGVDLTVIALPSPERHARMVRHREFDICELSMATYLSMIGAGDRSLVAVPAFPHRRFRHGYVFVREGSGVEAPADLGGRRIGLRTWQTTAGVWARGILQDDHGVDLRSIEWVTQDAEDAPARHANGYRIGRVDGDATVIQLLERGELDALIYPQLPGGDDLLPGIRRLFGDPKSAEVDYARRTGIFPIMHTVVIRRELLAAMPWLAREVLEAFRRSKDAAFATMRDPRSVSLAWLRETLDEQEALLGPDPWAYELDRSRTALEAIIRYAAEQGLVPEPFPPEELFAQTTIGDLPTYV